MSSHAGWFRWEFRGDDVIRVWYLDAQADGSDLVRRVDLSAQDCFTGWTFDDAGQLAQDVRAVLLRELSADIDGPRAYHTGVYRCGDALDTAVRMYEAAELDSAVRAIRRRTIPMIEAQRDARLGAVA